MVGSLRNLSDYGFAGEGVEGENVRSLLHQLIAEIMALDNLDVTARLDKPLNLHAE
jgi:hypothetical protein